MCILSPDIRFAALDSPRTVWAVSAVHGEPERLAALHDALSERVSPGDRLVYLGNYTGYGPDAGQTIDEILAFRRHVLSTPGMRPDDIIYLRGGQEEMWSKLLQLQFSRKPADTLLWMLGNGMSSTLQSYGISPHDGIMAAREGVMSLTRWTAGIRAAMRRRAGHEIFMNQYRRAAFTSVEGRTPVLFVNAGYDPALPFDTQEDSFWWSGASFNGIQDHTPPFDKIIRGYDPKHEGIRINCVTASLDGGCGFGGPLVAAGMSADGEIFELLEA